MLHNSLCLARCGGPSRLKKNREFSRDNRELKFPVTGSSSEGLLIFGTLSRKTPPNSHYISRAIFKDGLYESPRAGLVTSMDLASVSMTARAPSRAAQYVRMSTEHQQYSPENQLDVIRQYAATHNIEIVKDHSYHGRRGLNIAGGKVSTSSWLTSSQQIAILASRKCWSDRHRIQHYV